MDTEAEWDRIESVRLNDFDREVGKGKALPGSPAPDFDYADGLSMDEAAGLAVAMNPRLRAQREERNIAQAQLIGAGLLPNPEIETIWRDSDQSGSSGQWEINAAFELSDVLFLRGPRMARARLRLDQVRWEIAHEEWLVASDARLAFIDTLYWDEAIKLNDLEREMANQTLGIVRARKEQEEATQLDLNVAEMELAEIETRRKRLDGERNLAVQRLNLLIGMPPAHPTNLQAGEKPLAYVPIKTTLVEVKRKLLSRPDLKAAEREYDIVGKEQQLARRRALPRFGIGPSFARDGSEEAFGVALNLELPLFDRNQGDRLGFAARGRQARLRHSALLFEARSELREAWTRWKAVESELKSYFAAVAPRLESNLEMVRKMFDQGELDLFQVLQVRRRMLASKHEVLKRLLAFHRAKTEVDRAVGPDLNPAVGTGDGRVP